MTKFTRKQIKNFAKKKLFNIKDETFLNNKILGIHSWYPYVEGFSKNFVGSIMDHFFSDNKDVKVYDPFGGSGTTVLASSQLGFDSFSSEVNPFMWFITNTKINTVKSIISKKKINQLKKYTTSISLETFRKNKKLDYSIISNVFDPKTYFLPEIFDQFVYLKSLILKEKDKDIKDILMLCLSGMIVKFSNTKRATDLRFKSPKEIKNIQKDIITEFVNRLEKIIKDIEDESNYPLKNTKLVSENAKSIGNEYNHFFDIIITSPPYLNGTNYFRNTKLELWILDMLKEHNDLSILRKSCITAGINDVYSGKDLINTFTYVKDLVSEMEKVAYDDRIPKMISGYFSDMATVFQNMKKIIKPDGLFFFDIGDSIFSNIHIPTDKILEKIANENGFTTEDEIILRKRTSKNGGALSQKLFIFKSNG